MLTLRTTVTALAALATFATLATPSVARADAPKPNEHPAIERHGAIAPMPGVALQPSKTAAHQVLLDATGAPKAPDAVHPDLDKVARTLNLYASAGVEARNLQLAAILHGDATTAILSDEAYRAEHGTANPNLALLGQLKARGVAIYVCGQALAARGLGPDDVDANATVTLSAITTIAELQRRGWSVVLL